MNILENALAAGIVACILWAVAYSIKSHKPEFIWKIKPGVRAALAFVALFLLFVVLILNNEDNTQLAVGTNAAKHERAPSGDSVLLTGTLRCEPEKYVTPKTGEQSYEVGSTYTLMDFDTASLSRCDDKGCDTYKVIWQQSGLYTNIQSEEPRGFLIKISNEGEYFEMVSIQLDTLLYFGRCWNLFNEV